jgi:hypothetical protein
MVGLIVENGGGFCGIASVMRNPGSSFQSSAFQVTARGCAVGNLTYAHEHGHNMGFEHDPANGAPPNVASYPWSFGHNVSGVFRTVMSYQCPQGCTRVPHFSNPDVTQSGFPTGIAGHRDNHRTGDLTAPIVADFRSKDVINSAPPRPALVVQVVPPTTLGQVGRTALRQNFPNPFNPETWIPYDLEADALVLIHIYNGQGKLVRQLYPGAQEAGRYLDKGEAAYWDGKDQFGHAVSSGTYFYTLKAGTFQATRKMIILK